MKLKYFLYSVLASVVMLFAACSPDDDKLGGVDVTPEQLAVGEGFTIDVDQNTNQVTFTSKMPKSYSVYWEYGPMPAEGDKASISGTSTNDVYQLGIAFKGNYYVRMGVQTRGGIVFSDRAPFSIDKLNTSLLSDQLWTLLTGGVDHSKTWMLDLDADGQSIKFLGPKYFYTTGANWNNFHNSKGANYIDSKTWDASTAIEPSTAWNWLADWAGNSWICGAKDYGTMTFDLIGGANVDVNGEKGSFAMDVDNHTITFTGVLPLAIDQNAVAAQCPSGTYKLLYLSDNGMQILFDGANETPFTLNFISKDYKDNYVAPVNTVINLPALWKNLVLPMNQKQTSYKFDTENPYTYFSLSGEELKDGPVKYKASENLGDALIEINSAKNAFTVTDVDGNKTESSFTVSDGEYTTDKDGNVVCSGGGLFTIPSLPQFNISENADVQFGSKDKTLQLLGYEVNDMTGDITDIYLGSKQYDAQGNALYYLAYHLIKQVAGGTVESFTASLSFAAQEYKFLPAAETFITGEGDYTLTVVPDGTINTKDPHLMYLDIPKLLKKHPNADIVIKSVKVDGTELLGSLFTDTDIPRSVGDDPSTGRRYVLSPWGDPSNETDTRHYVYADLLPKFAFSNSIEVTFHVTYDAGEVVLK